MKFIDLFAGLGGFHLALSRLGHECVYACEIDPDLNKIYRDMYGMNIDLDIKNVDLSNIPKYDILCAGFPCQPFSKAGTQSGFNHEIAGDMFDILCQFLEKHSPEFLFLENVPNLLTHNNGFTWLYMKSKLENLGYYISSDVISPTDFNIPQTRKRLYILGSKNSSNIKWPVNELHNNSTIADILIDNPTHTKKLNKQKKEVLNIWSDFLKMVPDKNQVFTPIWSMEFGATYPYEETTPYMLNINQLKKFKGSFGKDLSNVNEEDITKFIPPYAQYSKNKKDKSALSDKFPRWKINFITKNREFYLNNKNWIDEWLKESLKVESFHTASFQKLEWNCHGNELNLENKLISFRSSGIRVKRLDNAPTLVNLTSTSLPFVTSKKRYLTLEECLHLQGFHEKDFKKLLNKDYLLKINRTSDGFFMRCLGNAVNVDVIEKIASVFLTKKQNVLHRRIDEQISLPY
jgi:DNA (cytosine-5)-methyltransferase 1